MKYAKKICAEDFKNFFGFKPTLDDFLGLSMDLSVNKIDCRYRLRRKELKSLQFAEVLNNLIRFVND